MSRPVRFRLELVVLAAALLLGHAPAVTAAPAFEIREPLPGVTEQTLALVRTAETPPGKIWVYFTDKNVFSSETAEARLAEVRAALSPRAAARRARVNDALVDYYDIPVHAAYVARLGAEGARVRRTSRWLNAVSVVAPLDALERIATLPFVHKLVPVAGAARTYPDHEVGTSSASSGTVSRGGLDYGASAAQLEEINVPAAHQMGLSGAGVRIATLDTGFQHTHEIFQTLVADGRLIAQYDFVNDDTETDNEAGDPNSAHNHGTYTCSAMAGYLPGELIGPAYGAEVLLAKTEDVASETEVEEDNWCAAAEWADTNGADIITTSLGYLDWYAYADMDGETATITNCADLAASRGIVVVTSAGNQGSQPWFYITAPADGDDVISVGAVDDQNVVAGFSSRGPTYDARTKPEVVARGVDTHCAAPPGVFGTDYPDLNGTSLSAPLVAGACALILEQNPGWTPAQVRAALMLTADTAGSPDNARGWGRIDVVAAMTATVATQDAPESSAPAVAVPVLLAAPNPLGSSTVLTFALGAKTGGRVEIFDVTGRRVRDFSITERSGAIRWDARDGSGSAVAPGVYVARLSSGTWRSSLKLVVGP